MRIKVFVHTPPTAGLIYDRSDDRFYRQQIDERDSESLEASWPHLVEALKRTDGVSVEVMEHSITSSIYAVACQDSGIPLVDRTGKPTVLLACMENSNRCWEPIGLKGFLEERGIPCETPPQGATIEGGDVVFVERLLFVRNGGRTNREGINWLRHHAKALGYEVVEVDVPKQPALPHLTTAATWAGKAQDGQHVVCVNPEWILNPAVFQDHGLRVVEVPGKDKREMWAANVLPIGDKTIVQANCPTTKSRLQDAGILKLVEIPWNSMLGMVIGPTCCCFILNHMEQIAG